MKKTHIFLPLILISGILFSLTACSKVTVKEGIDPYSLSKSEQKLLESFGLSGSTSRLFSFHAPKEAITLEITVSQLTEDGSWESTDNSSISIGNERTPAEQLSGTIAMQQSDDHSISFHIDCSGSCSFKSKPIESSKNYQSGSIAFLEKHRDIALNEEIPVALIVYDSGSSMTTYSTEHYFETDRFEGMDLVQAVTLRFSDQEL